MTEFAVVNFMALYAITSSLGPAKLLIETLQLTSHYALFNTRLPAIVAIFNSHIFKIVNFDAIDPSYSTDLAFTY